MAKDYSVIMVIREHKTSDLPVVDEILVSHGLPKFSVRLASDIGFIAEKNGEVVGSVFLYTTNSIINRIDLLCVKKTLTKNEKTQAIDGMMDMLMKRSRDMGYSVLMADPIYKKSGKRLLEYGFKEVSQGQYWMEF